MTGTMLDFLSGPTEHVLEVRTSSGRATVKGKVMLGDRAAPQSYVHFSSMNSRTNWITKADQNGDFVQELPVGEYHASATRNLEWSGFDTGGIVSVVQGEQRPLRLPLALE